MLICRTFLVLPYWFDRLRGQPCPFPFHLHLVNDVLPLERFKFVGPI